MAAPGNARPIFFVHIMRTGGTAVCRQVQQQLPSEEIYGYGDAGGTEERLFAKLSAQRLAEQPAGVKEHIRFSAAHLPFAAHRLLDVPVTTATILRHPVDRMISHLKAHARFLSSQSVSLAELYEDDEQRDRLFKDNQTKVMSMTLEETLTIDTYEPDDPLLTRDPVWIEHAEPFLTAPILRKLPMTDEHLAVAKANLEEVDVLGVHESYGEFVVELSSRLGIPLDPEFTVNQAAASFEVPPELRQQIEEDNQLDLELYEHARTIVAARRDRAGTG